MILFDELGPPMLLLQSHIELEKDAVVNSWIEWKEELSDDMEDVLTTMEDLCCECCRIIEGVVEDVNDDDNRGGIEVSVIETVLSD